MSTDNPNTTTVLATSSEGRVAFGSSQERRGGDALHLHRQSSWEVTVETQALLPGGANSQPPRNRTAYSTQ